MWDVCGRVYGEVPQRRHTFVEVFCGVSVEYNFGNTASFLSNVPTHLMEMLTFWMVFCRFCCHYVFTLSVSKPNSYVLAQLIVRLSH